MQKRRNRTLISAVVTLVACIAAFVAVRGEQLPIKTYSSADGLGSSFVNFMMRDRRGFLWFCTRDGLSRFDGLRFVTYQVGDQTASPGVESILETRDGIYWVTTTGGLYRFDPNEPYTETGLNGDRPVLGAKYMSDARGSMYEDSDGKIWFGSSDLFELKYDGSTVTFEKFPLDLPPDPQNAFTILEITAAADHSLWLITSRGLVRRLPDGRKILYRSENPRTDALSSVIEDRRGNIWLGRSSGVCVIRPEALADITQTDELSIRSLDDATILQSDTEKHVNLPGKAGDIYRYDVHGGLVYGKYLYETTDGHIWISTGDGVVEYDGDAFLPYSAASGLLKGVGQLLEDSGGNLWLGWSSGLARLDRKGFTTFDTADGLNSSIIFAIVETDEHKVVVSTSNFYLSMYNGNVFDTVRPPLPADARSTWTSNTVFEDSHDEWWFLTNERLYHTSAATTFERLANQKLETFDSKTGLKGDAMFHSFEDSHGDVWISNRGGEPENYGLAKWDRSTRTFHTFTTGEGFPDKTSIASFTEDRAGNIWLGAYEEGGLFRYSNGRFSRIESIDVPGGVISAMLIDKQGRLWLASTVEGLSRVDDPAASAVSFTRFTIRNGLASNNVRSLVEDDFGNIYAGTARGIDRISPDPSRIRHYSVSDGLAGDFVNASLRDSRGTLWFGTPKGLSRLVPEPDKESAAPPIFLGGIRIAGESLPVLKLGSSVIDNLDLDYTQNNLEIDYFGIDFSAGGALRYQYILDGIDTDWAAPTDQRTVNFSNLASGTYRFLVRAVNADGVASTQPAVVSFKITPPFWQRWWFIGALVLLVGFMVFSLDRYRLAKTRQVESALGRSVESETRFRTLAETASDAIITIDTASNIVFVNEAVERIFGYTSAELIGEKLTILMPEGLRPRHDAGLERYVSTNKKNIGWSGVELPARHKSGVEMPLEVSFGEFELNGERYFTGVARDISERKIAEEALRKAREERFRELERVRTRIATDLHDDIGASLTQIAVLSEVARGPRDDAQRGSHLQKIASISVDLVQSMGDIVWAINPRNDTLPNLLKRMRRFASDIFSDGKIGFDLETPDTDADEALGANIRREVFAIFKECVNNIARHSACKRAEIVVAVEDQMLRLRFSDDGCGFDAIEKLSESFSPEIGGNGLINIRRRASELGGTCEIDSKLGSGTNITIDIPLTAETEIATSHMAGVSGRDNA